MLFISQLCIAQAPILSASISNDSATGMKRKVCLISININSKEKKIKLGFDVYLIDKKGNEINTISTKPYHKDIEGHQYNYLDSITSDYIKPVWSFNLKPYEKTMDNCNWYYETGKNSGHLFLGKPITEYDFFIKYLDRKTIISNIIKQYIMDSDKLGLFNE